MSASLLLKHAVPLVRTHGFTRTALSLANVSLHNSSQPEPLPDTAVTALFGKGDDARRTLIRAWMHEGLNHMGEPGKKIDVRTALRNRLEWNEDALEYLPEAFAVLSTPFNPKPAFSHPAHVAQRACVLAGDPSIGTAWYARRGSIAAIYAAAELHQFTSPETAYNFLDSLLEKGNTLENVGEFAEYVVRSLKGIAKSRGFL
ncbi:hypothetical protein M422DRAFT_776199 [Sphaerobolus stellatus SS14]|nr:hypothetical protein M422DRAFT_776199 [Sphaerobolus stellatus SS14]